MSHISLISKVTKTKKTINIDWKDGKKSKFHFLWLRDNCPYGVHPTARQRTFNFLKVSEKIYPIKYSIKKNKLQIVWSENKHKSHYDPIKIRIVIVTYAFIFWRKTFRKKSYIG